MNSFDMVVDFVSKDGLIPLAGTYTETINGCGVIASVIATSLNLSERDYYRCTFWLFRMPKSDGSYHICLSRSKKEKAVAVITHTIPDSGSYRIWTSTIA